MKIKDFSINSLLLLNFSCAQLLSSKGHHPSWVNGLEEGTGSIKVLMGEQTFYRAITASKALREKSVCDQAIDKAADYLKQDYPALKNTIPYSVEVIYAFPEEEKCAATISVKNKNITLAEKIKSEMEALEEQKEILREMKTTKLAELKAESEREKTTIENERQELETQKAKLEKQKNYLLSLARDNKDAIVANNNLMGKIARVQQNLRGQEEQVKTVLFFGLKYKELNELLPDSEVKITFDFSGPCFNTDVIRASDVSNVGKTQICWKLYGSSYHKEYYVHSYCDVESKQCWSRDYRLGSK
jgi:hypothetical protein